MFSVLEFVVNLYYKIRTHVLIYHHTRQYDKGQIYVDMELSNCLVCDRLRVFKRLEQEASSKHGTSFASGMQYALSTYFRRHG